MFKRYRICVVCTGSKAYLQKKKKHDDAKGIYMKAKSVSNVRFGQAESERRESKKP